MEIKADSSTSVALIRQVNKDVHRVPFLVVACCDDGLEEILFHTLTNFSTIKIEKLMNSSLDETYKDVKFYAKSITYNQTQGTDCRKQFCCPKRSFKVLAEIAEYHKSQFSKE